MISITGGPGLNIRVDRMQECVWRHVGFQEEHTSDFYHVGGWLEASFELWHVKLC